MEKKLYLLVGFGLFLALGVRQASAGIFGENPFRSPTNSSFNLSSIPGVANQSNNSFFFNGYSIADFNPFNQTFNTTKNINTTSNFTGDWITAKLPCYLIQGGSGCSGGGVSSWWYDGIQFTPNSTSPIIVNSTGTLIADSGLNVSPSKNIYLKSGVNLTFSGSGFIYLNLFGQTWGDSPCYNSGSFGGYNLVRFNADGSFSKCLLGSYFPGTQDNQTYLAYNENGGEGVMNSNVSVCQGMNNGQCDFQIWTTGGLWIQVARFRIVPAFKGKNGNVGFTSQVTGTNGNVGGSFYFFPRNGSVEQIVFDDMRGTGINVSHHGNYSLNGTLNATQNVIAGNNISGSNIIGNNGNFTNNITVAIINPPGGNNTGSVGTSTGRIQQGYYTNMTANVYHYSVFGTQAAAAETCTSACDAFDGFPAGYDWSCIAATSLSGVSDTCSSSLIARDCMCQAG